VTAPDEGGSAVGSIVLGVVLGLLVQASGFLLAFLVLYLVVRVGAPRTTATATLVLDLVEVGAWFVAGAVAYEIARRRAAIWVTALVPLLIALYVRVLGLIIDDKVLGRHIGAVVLSWVVLTAVAYLGGRWWERHIRRTGAVE
jgi:hypothetical protein